MRFPKIITLRPLIFYRFLFWLLLFLLLRKTTESKNVLNLLKVRSHLNYACKKFPTLLPLGISHAVLTILHGLDIIPSHSLTHSQHQQCFSLTLRDLLSSLYSPLATVPGQRGSGILHVVMNGCSITENKRRW